MTIKILYKQPGLSAYEVPTIAPHSTSIRLQFETWDDAMPITMTPEQAQELGRVIMEWGAQALKASRRD
jgi:hypothetical protein